MQIDKTIIDMLWLTICAGLVFVMQAGFLCLESGLTRSKNSINVAVKNLADFGTAVILFWGVGYMIMFSSSIGIESAAINYVPGRIDGSIVFFFYEAMFCGTAVTILSGAVAERMPFRGYWLSAALISGLIYPVFGRWAWKGNVGENSLGWLEKAGFVDFAGSTVVHSVGGWVALAALLVIGPRIGRFKEDGTPQEIPGCSLPTAMLGVCLLWLGWFGMNGGCTFGIDESVPRILVNTLIGGAGGMIAALSIGLLLQGKVKVSNVINGCLAGLVGVTANCNSVYTRDALIIGVVAAIFMLLVERILLKFKIDDAIGAIPVHLGAGIWGTLAVGIFGDLDVLGTGLSRPKQLYAQFLGILIGFLWTFSIAYFLLKLIDWKFPLRISPDDEEKGLNVSEHGATTEFINLLSSIDYQVKTGDLSHRVPEEPFTEVGQIAKHYNRAIERLQQSVATFEAVFKNVREGIIICSGDHLNITQLNPAAQQLFGFPETQIVNKPVMDLIETEHPKKEGDAATTVSLSNFSSKSSSKGHEEMVGIRADGSTFPVEVSFTFSEIINDSIYIGTLRDITKRKQDEALLNLRNRALEAASNAIMITDIKEKIIWVNRAFEDLTGYPFKEIKGKRPSFLRSGKQNKVFYEKMMKTVCSGNVWHGEIINKRKDGTLYTEIEAITPVHDEEGNLINFIAIQQDITELKLSENRLRILLDYKAKTDGQFNLHSLIIFTVNQALDMIGGTLGHISLINFHKATMTLNYINRKTNQINLEELPLDNLIHKLIETKDSFIVTEKEFEDNCFLKKYYFRSSKIKLLAVPIIAHTTVLGSLNIGKDIEDNFTDDDIKSIKMLAVQVSNAIERIRLVSAFNEISAAEAKAMEMDQILDSLLNEIVDEMGCNYSIVWLVDRARDVLEMAKGKNLPQNWPGSRQYNLLDNNIRSRVVSDQESTVFSLHSQRRSSLKKIEIHQPDCIIAPIIDSGSVVGAIEAGTASVGQQDIDLSGLVQKVEQLGIDKGALINQASPKALLELIANRAIDLIGAGSSSIHVYRKGELLLRASAGKAKDDFLRRFMPRPSGIGIRAMNAGEPVIWDKSNNLKGQYKKLYDEGVRSYAAFPFSTADVKGVLYVHFWQTDRKFSDAETELVKTFAQQTIIAVSNSLRMQEINDGLNRRKKEVSALIEVDKSILDGAMTLDLIRVMDLILEKTLEITGAESGQLLWLNKSKNILELKVIKGIKTTIKMPYFQSLDQGIVGIAATTKKSILVSDVRAERWNAIYTKVVENSRSVLAVPILADDELFGVLNLEHSKIGFFTEDDRKLLEAFALQNLIAIHSAELYSKLGRQLRPLRWLNAVNSRVQHPSHGPEKTLALLLSGIVANIGLGFFQVTLISEGDEEDEIKGEIIVKGADVNSLVKATDTAQLRSKDHLHLSLVNEILDKIESSNHITMQGYNTKKGDSLSFNVFINLLGKFSNNYSNQISLGKSIILSSDEIELLGISYYNRASENQNFQIACIPLLGREGLHGCLLAQKNYGNKDSLITNDELSNLEIFASAISMRLKNHELIQAIETQRMQTWKEFTAQTVHTVGTRIGIIANTISLFSRENKKHQIPGAQEFVDKLELAVSKAQKVLQDFQSFTTPQELNLKKVDLERFIHTTISEIEDGLGFPITLQPPNERIVIECDPDRISDVFAELKANAQQSMEQISKESHSLTIQFGKIFSKELGQNLAQVKVLDTGVGVTKENKLKIFDYSFSTKGDGRGLGLAQVKKIIEEHHGTIFEIGKEGEGAIFEIRLPVTEEITEKTKE